MNAPLQLTLHFSDWLSLFTHFLMLSLLAVGGGVSTIPDMHRFLIERNHWLTDPQFSGSIAIAQSSPGPNILFVALMGWNLGLNAGGMWQGLLGLTVILGAMILPSSLLTCVATRWLHRNRELRAVRAFKQGMGPIVIALLLATAWILAGANRDPVMSWPIWLLTLSAALLIWLTRLPILWLLGTGAVLGWYHLI